MKKIIFNVKKGDVFIHKLSKDKIFVAKFKGFIIEDEREIDFEKSTIRRKLGDSHIIPKKDGYTFYTYLLNKKEIKNLEVEENKIKVLEAL